ncbi:MAG: GTPase domain-containing protein [Desulfobacterales bacterium]|nr:GTPase domain-containing protein [Desulfobacterales bacterium]
MAELNEKEKKLVIKIVYYGPALSGKTTNLMQLHEFMNPARCGEFMVFETKGDRTLFFDLLPMLIKSESGFKVKIKLFTVPGQPAHDATRKEVLSRADCVVFVADSQTNQAISNFESFDNLEKNTARVGLDFDKLPLVIQFNKRDLKDIITEEEVLNLWKPTGLPVTFSSAVYGRGVKETFEIALKKTYLSLNGIWHLNEKYSLTQKDFLQLIES